MTTSLLRFAISLTILGLGLQIANAQKDPHSYSNFDQVRVTHLHWDAFVDVPQKSIVATEELTIEQVQNQKSDKLVLDLNGIRITSIEISSKNRQYQKTIWSLGKQDTLLGQALTINILPDTRFVQVKYSVGAAAAGLLYMDANQSKTGKPFLFSQSESIFARTWLILQDAPQVRFSFDAKVTLPKSDRSLVLMSAPNNPKSVNTEGVYFFKQEHTLPSYLMSLAVGPIEYTNLGERTGFYSEKPMTEKAKKDLAPLEKMLQVAEKCFGAYPWERYDVLVVPERFPFGGMESPNITYASGTVITGDSSLVGVVIHEICHSWFGNYVTHKNWADVPLTEGFTEWGELTVGRMIYGDQYQDMIWQNEIALLKEELETYKPDNTKLYREMPNPEDIFDYIPYNKGALFLEALKNQIGLERTCKILRNHLSKNAWGSCSVSEFLVFLKSQLTKKEYEEFQPEVWFYQPNLPTNSPKFSPSAFVIIETASTDWKQGKELETTGWGTQHWLHFLDLLYEKGTTAQDLKKLNNQFYLADKNAEIQRIFYRLCVKNSYKEIYPSMEKFLMQIGRKKLIIPIYKELCENGEKMYVQKLLKAAIYHPITQMAIEANVPCAKL
jgi:leukotriene-A4 hydrolase